MDPQSNEHRATGDSQASAFASLTALRDAHTELLLSSKKGHQDADQQGLIRNFLARAKATGSRLDAPIEREAAQNILMYWDAQLYSAGDKATLDAALPRLDPFDPINSPDLSNVKSPFRGLSAFGEGDAARFLGVSKRSRRSWRNWPSNRPFWWSARPEAAKRRWCSQAFCPR